MQNMHSKFLQEQEKKILQRIRRCERIARSHRLDAGLKAQKLLPAQRHALARLHAGLYGVCVDCGEYISRERLQHVPAALRCVPCQKESEQ